MVIEIDLRTNPASIELTAPDDFGAFKVLARADHRDADRLRSALAHIGRLADSGHAFVPISAVERLARERARRSDWTASLERMRAYAATHGWTDQDGAIRAHVEWAT
jgi:hypothetical protein